MPRREHFPLTDPQKAIWYTEQVHPDSSISVVAGPVVFRGDLDYSLLEQAINKSIELNDSTRLWLVTDNGQPRQYVCPYRERGLKPLDFSQTGGPSAYEQYVEAATRSPFSLLESDLTEYTLFKLDAETGGFFLKVHHIVADAWAMALQVSQCVEFYARLRSGESLNDQPRRPSYLDLVAREADYVQSARLARDREFWRTKLSSMRAGPLFSPASSRLASLTARRKTLVLPKDLSAEIRNYAHNGEGQSAFVLMLAALLVYLNRITSKRDLVVGCPVLNRRGIKERQTLGMFVKALPCIVTVNEKMPFEDLVRHVAKESQRLIRHSAYPYDMLHEIFKDVRGHGGRLFDVMLSYQNARYTTDHDDLQWDAFWHFNGCESSALVLHVDDRRGRGQLSLSFDYQTALFSDDDVETMSDHFLAILRDGMANPSQPVRRLRMITEKQRRRIVGELNDTRAEYPRESTVQTLFAQQVAETPDNVAVACRDEKLTYRELDDRARRLAVLLQNEGVCRDTVVGICAERSNEMMVGIVAILYAGGAYLPLEPSYPSGRLKHMLSASDVRIVLSQSQHISSWMGKHRVVPLDDATSYTASPACLRSVGKATDLAYVLYTSGSTGEPKGIMMEHRSIVNRLHWIQGRYGLGEDDVFLQKASFAFDVSVLELLWCLLVGGRVVFLPPAQRGDPSAILDAIKHYGVTCIHFVPSMLRIFLEYADALGAPHGLGNIRYVFASGEALTVNHVKSFHSQIGRSGTTRLVNLYGPTEGAEVSYYDCVDDDPSVVPIGKPINNVRLHIVDRHGNLQPPGVAGELYIAGDALARGYQNRPGLTAERFVQSPVEAGGVAYRTGDLARWLPDGNIEFLGRIDHQTKLNGMRVELPHVVAALGGKPTEVPWDVFRRAVESRQYDEHINVLLGYLDSRSLSVDEPEIQVSCDRTVARLADLGFHWPVLDTDYLQTVDHDRHRRDNSSCCAKTRTHGTSLLMASDVNAYCGRNRVAPDF